MLRSRVDVLIGGQWGSEGKGQIAAFLAPSYRLLIRSGGPNAGHQVRHKEVPFTHHLLPSGTLFNLTAELWLAPGAVVDAGKFGVEIAGLEARGAYVRERVFIDRAATLIRMEDIWGERSLVQGIGSTGQGVGRAMTRRLARDNQMTLVVDDPTLYHFISFRGLGFRLSEAYRNDEPIFVEGTQGSGLSLIHGPWPYVTSRDTNVSGVLSECGIPPVRVRDVYLVFRSYPIRVQSPEGGTSGPMRNEISWVEVAKRARLDAAQLEQNEKTSTTHRQRRVSEWDWGLFDESVRLNGPSWLVLTFADYLGKVEAEQRIREMEERSGVRVGLVSWGFGNEFVEDRRGGS